MFVDFNILNQLGSPSINSNTFANRPSAGQVGRLFVSTDTFEIYRDNGTGWDLIGGPGSSTITGSGTANTFTIFTGTNSIGDSSYLTQGVNAINVSNAEINLPSNNVISGTNYGIKQIMATNDYWRIYGNTISSDVSEMVLELGDNAEPISINGQRYRFFHNNTWSGTAKDVLIVDYENSTFNTNVIVNSPNSIGIRTATPGAALDVHSTADVGFQLNGTGATPSILQQFLSAGVAQYEMGYNWNASADYRRFSIYDVQGAKEVISIDQQSRFVGINYQYSSLSDQPAYTFDVSGSGRFTDSGYFATSSGKVLIGLTTTAFTEQTETTGAIRFGTYLIRGNLGTRYDDPGLLMGGTDNTIPLQLVTPPTTFDLFRFYTTGYNNSNTGSAIKGSFSANSNTANFEMQAYTNAINANGNIVFNKNGGNIGIGGTPTQALTVFSTTDGQGALIENTTARSALTIKSTSGASCYVNFITTGSSNNAFFDFRSSSDYFNMATSFAAGYITFQTAIQQERARITSGGNFLIGTTTDAGQKLQVNGTALINNTATIGGTSVLGIDVNGSGGIANPAILATISSNDGNALIYRRTFGANTASAGLLGQLYNSNNSFNTYTAIYSQIVDNTAGSEDGRLLINCDKNGTETTELIIDSSGLKTSTPVGGTAAYWKFGQRVAAAVVLDATQYIELEVGGTLYKLAIVT